MKRIHFFLPAATEKDWGPMHFLTTEQYDFVGQFERAMDDYPEGDQITVMRNQLARDRASLETIMTFMERALAYPDEALMEEVL